MKARDHRTGKRRLGKRGRLLCGLALLLLLLASLGLALFRAQRLKAAREAEPGDLTALVYAGEPAVEINGGIPFFSREELRAESYTSFSPLDALGRCGPAMGCLGPELMPAEERGPIGTVRPSGWQTARYDDLIEDRYLYNRCHLIAYMLCGENDNERNLITGTRWLNTRGMLPYEILVGDYLERTGNHVLYRVTPVFLGEDLLASGVLIEAADLESRGRSFSLCRYVFNVQPGVLIDTRDGSSREDPAWTAPERGLQALEELEPTEDAGARSLPEGEILSRAYILNTKTKKFHLPGCPYAENMQEENRELFEGSREELLEQGYSPCGRCGP